MTSTLSYYLEDVNAQMTAGWTHLRLYRDTEPDGAFATLVESEALVADQQNYAFEDSTGTSRHWYRVALYNSGTLATSTKGDPFRPDVTRLLDVMLSAAERAGAGFASVCSATGTVALLLDETLKDQGEDEHYLSGGYVYREDAPTAADQIRRLTEEPFQTATGGLTPVRDWADEPEAAEVYSVWLLLPPFKVAGAPFGWADAARTGIRECMYEDQVDVGTGTGSATRFDLAAMMGYLRRGDIKKVYRRTYNADTGAVELNRDASKEGRWWKTEPNGRGQLTLIVKPAPTAEEHVIVVADRRDAEIFGPEDITSCPLELATLATVWKAYEYLNSVHIGKYSTEMALAERAFLNEYTGEAVFGGVKA